MTIQRSPGFYCDRSHGFHDFNWKNYYTIGELRKKYEGWEFKEYCYGYRFIDPLRIKVKYYNHNGSVLEIPCKHLSFSEF